MKEGVVHPLWDTRRCSQEPGRHSLRSHSLCKTTLPARCGSSRALAFQGKLSRAWAQLVKGSSRQPSTFLGLSRAWGNSSAGSVPGGSWGGTARVSPKASHFLGGMREKLFQSTCRELQSLSAAPFPFCGIFLFSSHPLALNSRITQN